MTMNSCNDFDGFYSLPDVMNLVAVISEVSLSCSINAIGDQNSVIIRNLLIDNYVQNLDCHRQCIIASNKSKFKDWLLDKIVIRAKSTLQSTGVLDNNASNKVWNSMLFPSNTLAPLSSDPTTEDINVHVGNDQQINRNNMKKSRTGNKKYTYSKEVAQITVNGYELRLRTAAILFSNKFRCAVSEHSQLIPKERFRKNKNCFTQNFKCNCCTTDIVLQFKNIDGHVTEGPHGNSYLVSVFIKEKTLQAFNLHFIPIVRG
jgi:hypothetical protein